MWAAQFFKFEEPYHWMTSGGLGTMGYGLPAAIGVQIAHPEALVIDIAGEASILMNIQEMSTAVQYRLPVKIFIINNQYMGMVRQWQELLHGGRYSESYTAALPDFVKLADAFGAVGRRVEDPAKLDDAIVEMLAIDRAVILDVAVDPAENCFPMIPSGAAHNEMLLGPEDEAEKPVPKKAWFSSESLAQNGVRRHNVIPRKGGPGRPFPRHPGEGRGLWRCRTDSFHIGKVSPPLRNWGATARWVPAFAGTTTHF